MSFILDALKKSETDRQRQNGPALFEVKVPPPRSGLPVWALAIVILLGVNMVVVAWMLLRHPAQAPAAATAASGQANVPYGQPAPYGQPGNPMATASSYTQPGQQQPQGMPLPGSVPMGGPGQMQQGQMQQGQMQQGQAMGQMPGNGQQPGMYPGTPSQAPSAQNGMNQAGAPQQFNREGGAGMDSMNNANAASVDNPDDYAPAADPGSNTGFAGHVKRGTEVGLPFYPDPDTAQASGLPQLRLDFHVFATKQQDRFVMINMHRLHEGDTTPEGIHLESITPDGVILSRNGSKYYLPKP